MTTIRYATQDDLAAMLEIHRFYVLNSTSTLVEVPRTPSEQQAWFEQFSSTGPHRLLVVEEDGRILGYAHSGAFRPHFAFRKTTEFSVYLDPDAKGRGLGKLLYRHLFAALKNEDIHLVVVGIVLPNDASIGLHKALGFTEVGVFSGYGVKHEKRYSTIWMQKELHSDPAQT